MRATTRLCLGLACLLALVDHAWGKPNIVSTGRSTQKSELAVHATCCAGTAAEAVPCIFEQALYLLPCRCLLLRMISRRALWAATGGCRSSRTSLAMKGERGW